MMNIIMLVFQPDESVQRDLWTNISQTYTMMMITMMITMMMMMMVVVVVVDNGS